MYVGDVNVSDHGPWSGSPEFDFGSQYLLILVFPALPRMDEVNVGSW